MEDNKNEQIEVLDAQEQPAKTEDKKNKRSKKVVIACIVVILIAIIAAVAVTVPVLLKVPDKKEAKVEKPVKASAYQLSGNGLEPFDLYFLQLEGNNQNLVYSPLSIKYTLAMLNEGTDGATHDQIRSVIGDYKAKKYNNNKNMSFANAIFIRDTFKKNIKKSYTDNLASKYGAEVITDPFTSPDPMNKWISSKTFNLIDNMLDDSVTDYNFFLINALAIDMNWNNQLQCEITEARIPCLDYSVNYQHENYSEYVRDLDDHVYDQIDFNGGKAKSTEIGASINNYDIVKTLGEENIRKTVGTKLKEYMDAGGEMCGETYEEYMDNYIEAIDSNYKQVDMSTDFYIYDDSEIKAFAKDLQEYDGTTLQYVAIMPKETELKTYIKELKAESLNNTIKNLKDIKAENFKEGKVTKITGHIPLFKYDYQVDLIKDLKSLGINDVFDINKADLSKLVENEKQYIDKVDHKATIEFSNDGIKASAVTVGGGKGSASCPTFEYKYDVPVETIDITFNKPYLYLIRDKDSGEVWFVGTVYKPIES